MSEGIRESMTGIDRLFLDALVAEEYELATAAAAVGGARLLRARRNHALAEGYDA
jgi:hypothetical protein